MVNSTAPALALSDVMVLDRVLVITPLVAENVLFAVEIFDGDPCDDDVRMALKEVEVFDK